EAAEAKEAAKGDDKGADSDLDLARLAPPAPETVAAGTAAPPRNGPDGRPAQPGRQGHSPGRHESPGAASALNGPGGVTRSTPPGRGRVPGGRPAGAPRQPIPMPSGSPVPPRPGSSVPGSSTSVPGLDDGPAADREGKRDPGRGGRPDPDEPTEGLRLMQ